MLIKKLVSMVAQILYFHHFRPRSPFSKLTLLSYIIQGCHNHPILQKKFRKRKNNRAKSKNIEVMLQ